MKKKSPIILLHSDTAIDEIEKEKLLARKFFPSWLLAITYLINVIYKVHPKTSYFISLKLFSFACRIKLSANALSFYKKGIKREVTIDNATFCTYTYGEGPAILMLHGWCSNAARWRTYVDKLVNAGYKVVVVDAPGHGTAPGRFLSVFLYAKGIRELLKLESHWHTVITHSIAGITAIAALGTIDKKHHPTKFVMMNSFSKATNLLEKFSRCIGISNNVMQGIKAQLSARTDLPLNEFNISEHFNAMNAKGLLIYDTKDKVVSKAEANFLINNIKPLRVFETKGLGHNLKSSVVVDEVLDFVRSEENHTIPFNAVDEKIAAFV